MVFIFMGAILAGFGLGWSLGMGVTRWMEKDIETRDPAAVAEDEMTGPEKLRAIVLVNFALWGMILCLILEWMK